MKVWIKTSILVGSMGRKAIPSKKIGITACHAWI